MSDVFLSLAEMQTGKIKLHIFLGGGPMQTGKWHKP